MTVPGVTERAKHLEFVALEVAAEAAAFVRSQTGAAIAAATKSTPTDVVTHTDRESERRIRAALLTRSPGSAIMGEEFDADLGANNVGWIVDPIDGTVNFLYDLPVISVSIAATIDGEVVAGAVADVLRGDVFSATLGGGARLNGIKICVAQPTSLALSLIGTGFAYDAKLRAQQATVLSHLLPACRDIRCMGSAALNLCWVGCARLDGYFERDLKVYDFAAGALIAAEAGAVVEVPAANEMDMVIAAATTIFDPLRSIARGRA